MSLKQCTPCDCDGTCPYRVNDNVYVLEEYTIRFCEYWCGADEPEDYPDTNFYND